MNGISYRAHCASCRDNSAVFSLCAPPMNLFVSLSHFPPFIRLWLSFFNFEPSIMTAADPDHSPLLLLFLCFQDTIVFLFRLSFFFFFSSGAFFEGPLLMQFPVILLALSLNLNWLCWSRLGASPRPWLHKPVCDISGPCTISSSLWILLACAAPWCSLYNSLCGQAVRVNRLWQVVNQYENKGMGKGGDKKIQRTNWTWEAKLPSDWAVWQGIKMFPFLCVYKKNLFCTDSQEQIRGLCEEILHPLSSLFDKTSTHHPTREQDMLTLYNVHCESNSFRELPQTPHQFIPLCQTTSFILSTNFFWHWNVSFFFSLFSTLARSIMYPVSVFGPNKMTERSNSLLICFKSVLSSNSFFLWFPVH